MSRRLTENSPLSITALSVVLVFLVSSCFAKESELTVLMDGKLYLGEVKYSADTDTRELFRRYYEETERVLSGEGATLKDDNVILSYESLNKPLFEAELVERKIYRVVIFSQQISFEVLGERKGAVGIKPSEMLTENSGCKALSGEEPGSYILCSSYPKISFYTECESDPYGEDCIISRVLLNNY